MKESERTKSLGNQAYDQLVKQITRLDLPPGSVLAERTLIESLGIGRTPIREALQRLSIEGLVVHRMNRGMFVADVTYTHVREIYEFRSMIDGYACRLAARRATKAQADRLSELHQQLVKAINDDNLDAYVENGREFYKVLAAAANNSFISEIIPRIINLHLRLWFIISSKHQTWRTIAEHHQHMIFDVSEAIAQGDGDRAELAVKNYISQRQQELKRLLE